jgi:hypothetical protein
VDNFQEVVEACTTDGCTALFDALRVAGESLVKFKTGKPGSFLRILCLTDGEDNHSKHVFFYTT